MKSEQAEMSTLEVEVNNISMHGIWMYVNGCEYFLSFKDFPWFKDANVSDIHNVTLVNANHLHWDTLDIDLEVDTLKDPSSYPLIYKAA